MKRVFYFFTFSFFLFVVFLASPVFKFGDNVVFAGCCDCGTKTDAYGVCDVPAGAFNCSGCQWCGPGEGSCPKPPPTCQPNCNGKQCGPNGCGGSCGSCGAGVACVSGQCIGEGGATLAPAPTGGSGGYSCTNPASCGGGQSCCQFFICDTREGPTKNKCISEGAIPPNKLACRNGGCTGVYAPFCTDCWGGCPLDANGNENCSSCCKDECQVEGLACISEDTNSPPPPTSVPGCGVSGKFTFVGAKPLKSDFYGWIESPPGEQNRTSFRQSADAGGYWSRSVTCGSKVFGGADVSSGWSKSPTGAYAYTQSTVNSWITNWNFTVTAPTATPTPNTGRVRTSIFIDANKNGRKNASNTTEPCFAGKVVSLQNTNSDLSYTATSQECAASGDAISFSFNQVQNGSYAIDIPTIDGYSLLTCADWEDNKPNSSVYDPPSYFYCLNSNGNPRIYQWITGDGNARNMGGPSFEVAGDTVRVYVPMVPTSGSTPPPSDSSAWMQLIGGSVYQQSINQEVPSGQVYLDHLYSSTDKSLGVLYANNVSNITLGQDTSIYREVSQTYTNAYNYAYFSQKLASQATPGASPFPSDPAAGVYTYPTGLTVGSSVNINPTGGNGVVYLIDGNLTINGNITIANNKSAVFIVSGTITVGPTVTQIEGIYISNDSFDAEAVTNDLQIDGMIYTNEFIQKVSDGDTDTPTYVIEYQPQYLLAVLPYLGKTHVSWQEVAP